MTIKTHERMSTLGDYRITPKGAQFIVPSAQLCEFRSNVRRLGMVVVVSSPVCLGFAVTVA